MKKYSIYALTLVSLYACNNVGSSSDSNNTCPSNAPMFTVELGTQLINEWGNRVYYYSPYGTGNYTDVYTGAAYFTGANYTPDAILLPTVSAVIRDTPQSIYEYFTHFLANGPIMTNNPESSIPSVTYANCGSGVISGYYDFAFASGKPTVRARYTFQFVYEPAPQSITITVESGSQIGQNLTINQPDGWYVMLQHSSALPSTDGIPSSLIVQ